MRLNGRCPSGGWIARGEMMEKEQYCVATMQNTIVFEGTRNECLDYIHQAIQKGQKVGYLRTTTIAELEAETLKEAEGASPFPTNEKKPCPVDRGKLLIGLECCRRSDPERCEDCPYNCNFIADHYCGGALTEDALAYIGWQEDMLAEVFSPALQGALHAIIRVLDDLPESEEKMP